jgi:hypothetical protein
MDKSSILRAFNTLFFDFLDDVIRIFPEQEDIRVSREFFATVKKANPTVILKSWYKYLYLPYVDVIEGGNIDFFFEKDYEKDLHILPHAKEVMRAIDTIREPVRNMSEVNKAHSLKYVQNLSKLACAYV